MVQDRDAVIRVEKVNKRFILHHSRPRSIEDLVLGTLRRDHSDREEFWAVRDVSFDIPRGQAVGLIGPNGAGKSTLLKLIARIIRPTSGRIIAKGRVGALLEVVAGFHEELTGRENVYLGGSLMGLSRREIKAHLDEIVSFAEMEKFIDSPVKHYSTGMYMRLGFAVATTLKPDILLIDESLAVGDASFQRKCLIRIDEIREQGAAVLFVSHIAQQVEHLCSRALLLWDGRVHADDTPGRAQQVYDALRQERLEALRSGKYNGGHMYAAEYRAVGIAPRIEVGQSYTVPVTLHNTSPASWDCPTTPSSHTIALAYHWLDHWGKVVVWDGERTRLPRDILPGEQVTVPARIVAPDQPGLYRLEVELLDEGVAWFSQHGVTPCTQEVQVVLHSGESPTPDNGRV